MSQLAPAKPAHERSASAFDQTLRPQAGMPVQHVSPPGKVFSVSPGHVSRKPDSTKRATGDIHGKGTGENMTGH